MFNICYCVNVLVFVCVLVFWAGGLYYEIKYKIVLTKSFLQSSTSLSNILHPTIVLYFK